ncbi:MAG TPA: hypothetical protein VGQ28_03240, partial [Thermoanaerobaculia bacterium]|nr:hypothetical protein [Thermoanaerobaculia bacterium]
LRLSLRSWREWEGEHQRRPSLHFRAATGSATASAKDVEEPLATVGVDLCRAVLPDDTLHELTLDFLRDQMGWDLGRVALLVEADTAYGRSVLDTERAGHKRRHNGPAPHAPLVMVPFPSHISELRTAAEKEKAAQAKAAAATQTPIPSNSTVLELDLSGPGQPADLVPTFDSLTVLSNQLVLENLLQAVSREGIRYVGILATDVKDKLFLAEQVRARVPDAVLFTLDNDLLFAHPQYLQTLDGLLVLSSAPLLAEGAPWQPVSLSPVTGRMRRQFSSSFQQGIYEAVRYLLGEKVVHPRAWIMAVGNGSLWPVARLNPELPQAPVRLCGVAPSDPGSVEGNGFAGKDDLEVLLVTVFLAAFAWRLRRAALLEPVAGAPVDYAPDNRRLVAAGTMLLALAAGALLAVGSVPFWARGLSLDRRAVIWQTPQILYLVAVALVYILLVGAAARAVHQRPRLTLARAVIWTLVAAVGLALLAAGLRWLCMPNNQVELFHLRARAFSSGLSPLVSLAAVGWAVYAWILWELKRRRLISRQSTDCPVEALGDPATSGSEPVLAVIRDLVVHTLPTDRRLWLLPAV